MLFGYKVMSRLINRLPSAVRLIAVLFIAYTSCISMVHAQSTIEVGTATLPAYTTATATTLTPFTTINFQNPFPAGVIPNVFPMNTTMGPDAGADPAESDPCTIRIRNITNTGFDAFCLEPVNENRDHVLIMMDYIAIVDGITTVPANTGDPVIFESSCETVSAQQYGIRCDDCEGDRSYDSVTFATDFTAAPALLTQMVTTNIVTNTTISGEPDFIDVAIQSGSLNADGFMVAIERMEAGVGELPMGASEQICYLAVEREGCRDLNLSSFGGPASVEFNAVFGGNVDGFDNGATSGEGATFTSMCFVNAPIAVAKQISRNGADGGFLRRDSVSAAEIILTYDEDQISNSERGHIDEEVAVFAFGSAFTTPVTLNRAQITQRGRNTFFEWETAAEALHLGFNLWGEMNGEWVQLNKRFIVSSGLDTDRTTQYRHKVRLSREQFNGMSQFGISSVDNSAYEEFYGPFEVGQEYGELADTQAIDWTETRKLFDESMAEQGYVFIHGRWRRVSERRKQRLESRAFSLDRTVVEIPVVESGIHNISYEQLVALEGIDASGWQGQAIDKLAISLNGQAVPRVVISDDEFFNQGDRIVFYGRLPQGKDSIYLSNYVYQLNLDRFKAVEANQFDGHNILEDQDFSTEGEVTQKISNINAHSVFIRSDDPWYDSQIRATSSPTSKSFDFDLEQNINTARKARLELSVFGGINFPGSEPDHHFQVRLNGVLIDDVIFDGNVLQTVDADLPADLLKSTANVLTVTLPADTGYIVDLIQIDEISISGFKPLSAETFYRFNADKNSVAYSLDISNLSGDTEIYAHDRNGGLTRINPSYDAEQQALQFAALPLSASAIARTGLEYSVADAQSWLSPVNLEVIQNNTLHSDEFDYLIIAHPSFIGEKLDEFVELKQQQGLKPIVLNWLDIVSAYGFGNDSPAALEEFLRVQSNIKMPDYVLLVGGHTFDYANTISQDVVNFLPTHYLPLGIFNFAPSDNPYADLDGDNIPELAIGRWPVRSNNDLATIVNKTIAWHSNRQLSQYQNALLLAQANDSRSLNYTSQMEGRVAQPLSVLPEYDQFTRVYLEELIESGVSEPITQMREQIAQSVSDGVDLISFAGHGSNAAWGTQNLINTNFVQSLNNQGRPPVVMPLACYTTNYESLTTNTLAHQWLFADIGDQQANNNVGSVAIHGATVLGQYRENAIFAERYLNQVDDSSTIGQAIKKAKQQMATQNRMLNNWALLGDPALPLR